MKGPGSFRQALPSLLQLLFLLVALIAAAQLASYDLGGALGAMNMTFYGDRLRQTSDDLTRMARLYAVTGEPRYREYFDEILAIRNGDAPRPQQYHEIPWWDIVLASEERPTAPGETLSLRNLLAQNIRRQADLALLLESEDQSNALTALENEVMDKVTTFREAAAGEYLLEGDALDNMLRLHGAEYHAGKEGIMKPLVEFVQRGRQQMSFYGLQLISLLGRNIILMLAAVVLAILASAWALLRRRRGPIRTLLVALQLLLLLLPLYLTRRLQDIDLAETEGRIGVASYADRLRQTSDDLTRMARLYAITGDPLYRAYFDEILAIRNGAAPRPEPYHEIPYWDIVLASGERPSGPGEVIAMRQLFEASDLTDEQLALLLEAENQSNVLAALENEIMDRVTARGEAGGGVYALQGTALDDMLRLHGPEYHAAKERIMRPLAALTDIAWQETQALVRGALKELLDSFALIVAALTLAFLFGVGILMTRRDQTS